MAAAASLAPGKAEASASGLEQASRASPASSSISTTAGSSTAPPPSASTSPLQAALFTMLTVIVLGLALWSARRLWRPDERASHPPSLLPMPRHGATPHERLRDPKYLNQILEAEAVESEASGQRQPQPPQAGSPAPSSASNARDRNSERAPDRSAESDRPPAD